MFYIMDNDKLAIFDDVKENIETTLPFTPQLANSHIIETDIVTAEELRQYPNKVVVADIEIEIDVPDYETIIEEYEEVVFETELVEEEYQEMVLDVEGNPVLDEDGNFICETKTRTVKKPIMIDVEETILVPVYDEEGNFVEEKEETVVVQKQKSHIEIKTREKTVQTGSHKETITVKGLVLNPDFEAEEAQKEAERIAKLSLTKREVFLALYQDKGISPEQIRSQITDTAALIEFDYAEKYYRGNPLIDMLGQSLGYTKEQLDYLFEHKTFASTTSEEESEINLEDNAEINGGNDA